MYTQHQSQTVKAMGDWLGGMPWETFSTITYRYDVKPKQNVIRQTKVDSLV
jgi:hypothetical protein